MQAGGRKWECELHPRSWLRYDFGIFHCSNVYRVTISILRFFQQSLDSASFIIWFLRGAVDWLK